MWRGLLVLLVVCAGCGAGPASSESFLTALPSRQTLELTAPSAHAPAALSGRSGSLVGEPASLYVLTRQMTAQVNGVVGGALDTIGDITRTPPAAVSPDSAVWGPFTETLSPVAARLLVTRVGSGAHRFVLELRPKSGQDSDFEPFLEGASTGAAPGGPSQGSFALDLDLAHRLDPVATPAEGRVVAGWTVVPDGPPRTSSRRWSRTARARSLSTPMPTWSEARRRSRPGRSAPAGTRAARGARMWSCTAAILRMVR
jgi:hypothetical protein